MAYCNYVSLRLYFAITLLILLQNSHLGNGGCPKNTNVLKRLNTTRFYIIQSQNSRDEKTKWSGARRKCTEQGLKLAIIDSFAEDATIGRALELTIAKNLPIPAFPKYWIDGIYKPEHEAYVSGESDDPLPYHNILYKGIRAVGYGNDISRTGYELKPVDRRPAHCLVYAITYFALNGSNTTKSETESYLGYETRMEEMICEGKEDKELHYTLCEADRNDCANEDDANHLEMTDVKDAYLEEGNWIFGNPRKFMVNWKPRTREEAKAYCEKRNMVMYRPTNKDGCLIPYLALWNRRITTANFWTEIKYGLRTRKFKYPSGEEVPGGKPFANATTPTIRSGDPLGIDEDPFVCVQVAYSYEEFGWSCQCEWNAMILVPANCAIKVGTICVHVNGDNKVEGSCGYIWGHGQDVYNLLNDYKHGRQKVVNETHTIPFMARSNYAPFYRSTYKQIWGPRLCPRGYTLATTKTVIPLPDKSADYFYDAEEDYWVAEELRGFNLKGNKCSLSKYDRLNNRRTIVSDVDCNEWHFYLCEKGKHHLHSKRPKNKPAKKKSG